MTVNNMLKPFIFSTMAILIIPAVSCFRSDNTQPGVLIIIIERDDYVPSMSSTVGIDLLPVYEIEPPVDNLEFNWSTNYGYFITWNSPDSVVKIIGTELTNSGERIYWSYNPKEMGIAKPSVLISLRLLDKNTEHAIAAKNVRLEWRNRDTAIVMN